MEPWDQRIARRLVRPLVASPCTPNHLTLVTLLLALVGCGLLADGSAQLANWGAGLFVLSRFLDHFDGELARQKQMRSKLGYYLDYVCGALSYGAMFACLGIGFRDGWLGEWSIVLGLAGTVCALISMFTNLGIDQANESIDAEAGEAVGYPGLGGFELEDGIYLLAPVTWLGWLQTFFIAAGIGAAIYCLWTCWTLARLRAKS